LSGVAAKNGRMLGDRVLGELVHQIAFVERLATHADAALQC
jgi:hypothetical protein